MRYSELIKKHIKNSTIQNIIFLLIIFILWILFFLNINSNLKSISKINLNKFNDMMNNYYYHLKYISIINDEKLLEDINISKFYVIDEKGNIRKALPPIFDKENNISDTNFYYELTNNNSGIFIFKTNDEISRLYIGGKFNKTYLVGELEKINFGNDSNYFVAIKNKKNEIIYSKYNLKSISKILYLDGRLYINFPSKWNEITLYTFVDITNQLLYNLVISLIMLIIIIWNFVDRKKNLNFMNIFEMEFSKIIKSMENFLKELRILDKQSFLNVSERDFEDVIQPIKNEEFYFEELKELKEVEFYSVKEILELFDEISASTEELEATNKELEDLYLQIEKAYNDLEESYRKFSAHLSSIAEKYDEITGNHIERVAKYSKIIAKKMGYSAKFVSDIEAYAPLHDIGKLMIKHEILNKPGGLTRDEYEEMKKHTVLADKIFGDDERFKMAKNIAMYHHENYDGTGYPFRLKGEDIPIEARIVALADIYDALRSERPYKDEYTHEEAYNIIVKGDFKTKPSIFDPEVLEVFKKYHLEFDKIYTEYKKRERIEIEKFDKVD
ncbi:Response regulator c-di-GMP phosphodiesterase, RpfG family, contains REC and HD-GYP domains [Marinitoga hydrogenitolerans DSM 16785]|uniref:Response regulator c-di-GMP phosphodiesterase, RpfG family, contains REC and HD-GYP domains n=1 Tax=Marinitoga hydrogenitolerans (strain DSM 16785 / JCM 12826 / AT1271) TaxID=1122195 RepID=A0A1M4V7Q9_MARH1|nr:HD domain-containing phosphohydrolase [Marinitoga hydrogenitolerans]SHE64962.1 Response regulator c-di-GMP phosphodiesterase, RpfG family, contains REC and HD-GYP domains [Marinitoga hydrogenitolerans DSM 16785]